jgi:peptidoglycan/xylan/chitin deacetylase (PgdA/CDA1 family)
MVIISSLLRSALLTLLAIIAVLLPNAASARHQPSPKPLVLLSFDVELDEDEDALAKLGVDVPVSYFVTGEFAERHPELVAHLALGNTLGSHTYSHPDLAKLSPKEVHKELLLSKLILERIIGRNVDWLRAPYLSFTDEVMETARDVGYRYDSSDQEWWAREMALPGYPIATAAEGEQLASDDYFFNQRSLSDDAALAWLNDGLVERAKTGQPMLVLLHPRIIAGHAAVLRDFIGFARSRGAAFMSLDQYREAEAAVRPTEKALWVDFTNGAHSPEQTAADARQAHITDVFLMAKDPEGNWYAAGGSGADNDELFRRTLDLLHQNGIPRPRLATGEQRSGVGQAST